MPFFIKKFVSLLLTAALFLFCACLHPHTGKASETSFRDTSVFQISSASSTLTMAIGEITRLNWPAHPPEIQSKLVFSSSIPAVATVDESGLTTALSEGMTLISIAAPDGKQAEITLRVKPKTFSPPG